MKQISGSFFTIVILGLALAVSLGIYGYKVLRGEGLIKDVTSIATPAVPASSPSAIAMPQPEKKTEEELVEEARQDLANSLALPVAEVEIKQVEAVTWNDGSLGCPEPGTFYTQALVPGYKITLAAAGEEYDYHTNMQHVKPCFSN